MKAIVQPTYGTPEVFQYTDIAPPAMQAHEILLRVHAAGLDRGTWHLMAGLPYLIRIMGYGLRRPSTRIPGLDVAGRVEAIGSGVTRFKPGDAVYGEIRGAYAEYAVATENQIALKPPSLTFEQAAVLPVSGRAALQAVRDEAEVHTGQSVLIIGASGGVGTFAVQLARVWGAEVTGVCRTEKMEMVRSLGASDVIDYTKEEITARGKRYDAILDIGGNRPLSLLRKALHPKGTLVIVGGEGGGRWTGGIGRQIRALLLSPWVKQTLRAQFPNTRPQDLEALGSLAEAGHITPVVDRTFALSEVPRAMQYLLDGHARGKIAIRVYDA